MVASIEEIVPKFHVIAILRDLVGFGVVILIQQGNNSFVFQEMELDFLNQLLSAISNLEIAYLLSIIGVGFISEFVEHLKFVRLT